MVLISTKESRIIQKLLFVFELKSFSHHIKLVFFTTCDVKDVSYDTDTVPTKYTDRPNDEIDHVQSTEEEL